MIENPRVIDRYWSHLEPKVVGDCVGCGEEILKGQDIYDFEGGICHLDSECCEKYIAEMSVSRVAGE